LTGTSSRCRALLVDERLMNDMKLHDSAPERNVSPEEALAYCDAHSKGFVCSICGKKQYEQEGLIQGLEDQLCQCCVNEFYNIFI